MSPLHRHPRRRHLSRPLRRLHRDQTGAETVEFAILLPLILLVAFGAFPVLDLVRTHREVGRVADEAVMYATQVDATAVRGDERAGQCGKDVNRRRSTEQVRRFAAASSPQLLAADPDTPLALADDVTLRVLEGPAGAQVETQPCTAALYAGDPLAVEITVVRDAGPLARSANAVARLVGGGDLVPNPLTVTATSVAHLQ